MSRTDRPKQLLGIIHGRSLLEVAVDRLEGLVPPERTLICTAEAHRTAIRALIASFTDDRILGEPVGRDTVNAIGFTAAVLGRRDPDAVFAVLTADHIIEPIDEFQRTLGIGFDLVESDPKRLVTFSIVPTHPATGYGYLHLGDPVADIAGAFHVRCFVEKPDEPTARGYLESGEYGWNSGMFIFRAASYLDALAAYCPEAAEGIARIAAAWDTPDRQAVLESVYPALPKISVDFAVMEPASTGADFDVCTVPMKVTWLDVGSWTSYGETLEPDAQGNRTNARVLHLDSEGVLAVSDDPAHLIATIGCRDLVIVRTPEATLVCPADRAQEVRELAARARGSTT